MRLRIEAQPVDSFSPNLGKMGVRTQPLQRSRFQQCTHIPGSRSWDAPSTLWRSELWLGWENRRILGASEGFALQKY